MKISDMVMSHEKTKEFDIVDTYLPEDIRETAFVWLVTYNPETGDEENMLLSRDYVNKMKPEGNIRPALSVYDMLKLIGNSTINDEMLLDNKVFMDFIVGAASVAYRTIVDRDRNNFSHDYGPHPEWSHATAPVLPSRPRPRSLNVDGS